MAESKADVYAPVATFVRTFPLMALLSLWVVLWLSLTQIRKSLGPLDQLKEGTRRIATGGSCGCRRSTGPSERPEH